MKKTNSDFQAFWDAYALKRDRIAAERAWKRLSTKDQKAAIDGITSYREDCERRGISRMYAQGYLNHRRWEDETEAERQQKSETLVVPAEASSLAELADMEKW